MRGKESKKREGKVREGRSIREGRECMIGKGEYEREGV